MINDDVNRVTIGGRVFIMYARTARQRTGANAMSGTIRQFPDIRFWQPDPEKSPWHIKARICGVDCDFWYTTGKAAFDGIMKFGSNQINQEIRRIVQEDKDDNFHVIEDC